ncbi:hypothetical protein VaNZ11_007585 [Volvox africanus]|uniref:SCP domain-containing protein n=1 Tax=Volvox africanus TaxID=51714 RepID=A0ABQ5S3T0_9CHLO|nr:hypothetical protein VaNZ11_007585 [Volvox africanus]
MSSGRLLPWPRGRLGAWALLFFLIQISTTTMSLALASDEEPGGLPRQNANVRRFLLSSSRPRTMKGESAEEVEELRAYSTGAIARRKLAGTCIKVSGYVSFPNLDHAGDTIANSGKPAMQCLLSPACLAYNSAGELKASITPLTAAPGRCLYIKQAHLPTACANYTGFLAVPDVDHIDDNMTISTVSKAFAQCRSDTRCKGFNSAGWTKSAVSPTVPAKGLCLYIKITAETAGNPPPTSTSTSTPPPSSTSSTPFNSTAGCYDPAAALAEHNKDRALHGCAALTWNESLAKAAQAWAQLLADNCTPVSSVGKYGENLYILPSDWPLTASDAVCVNAVKFWYNGINSYKFTSTPWTDNAANFGNIGLFTQVVWKSTTQVGCGAALGNGNKCLAVSCRYLPPGNYIGNSQFFNNVPPLK